MKSKYLCIIIMVWLCATPLLSFSQNFQTLYDLDSTFDWGQNIFITSDSNYCIFGFFQESSGSAQSFYNLVINHHDFSIVTKKTIQFANTYLYFGVAGEVKQIPNGCVSFISIDMGYGSAMRGFAALVKYDNAGDTIFLKKYTDTSIYFDAMSCTAIMPDGGYIGGGDHGYDTPSYFPGYIIRTDSLGDTLWTHTYRLFSNQYCIVYNLIPLQDGRIVAAAQSISVVYLPGSYSYYLNLPWFMLLDSHGNIIRDTLYSSGFEELGGLFGYTGELYADKNGGYINIGAFDSLFTPDPSDLQNFPNYIAHLDTNFRITWITEFPYTDSLGWRTCTTVKQLTDSSYIISGTDYSNFDAPYAFGWAAHISRTGEILWSKRYTSDNFNYSYFEACTQRPDGSLLFTGCSGNDTLPHWHTSEDVWLVGTDTSGCDSAECWPLGVSPIPAPPPQVGKGESGEVLVYPNPATNMLYFNFPANGSVIIKISDITGRLMESQRVNNAASANFNVHTYSKGVYVYQIILTSSVVTGKVVIE